MDTFSNQHFANLSNRDPHQADQAQSDLLDSHPPVPEGDEDLCRALWLSVIVQVVSDARSHRSRPCFKHDRDCALRWIIGDTGEDREDFRLVCDLAGVDAGKMRRAIDEALASKDSRFNFRCLMKHALGARNGEPESRKSYLRRLRRKEERDLLRSKQADLAARKTNKTNRDVAH